MGKRANRAVATTVAVGAAVAFALAPSIAGGERPDGVEATAERGRPERVTPATPPAPATDVALVTPAPAPDAAATGTCGRSCGPSVAPDVRAVPAVPYQHVSPWTRRSPGPRRPERGWTLLFLGDSMALATRDALQSRLPAWNVSDLTFGGTAPCDWVGRDILLERLEREQPDVVVFSFIGNSITPCTGQQAGVALLRQYERDLMAICAAAAPARCVAVGQPVLGPDVARTLPGPDEPTSMYRHHALLGHWGFVDAGAATESPSGSFDPSVRSADGVHFDGEGAERYAATIATYLTSSVD